MAKLIGIARLAAESPLLEAKRSVEYFEIPTRSFISRCPNPKLPFAWTANPYRGCEFGCKYCYARYAHEFMELRDPFDFERKIYAKHFDRASFLAELARLPLGESIAIGTATDPYQPAERRYRVTRAMLETFATVAGFHVWITTKSNLVTRDIDVLKEVSRRHYLSVSLTITTLDADLARLLEPLAPRPDLRVNAIRKLTASGIRAVSHCSPVLPLINDSESALDALARAGKRAGSQGFGGHVLFLKPCARQVFMPFLEERFPHLVRRYRERFQRAAYLRGDYPDQIQERIRKISRRYWPEGSPPQPEPELWPQDPQLSLWPVTRS